MNFFFFKNNSSLRYKFIINIKKIDIYFELRTPILLKMSDSSGFTIKNLKIKFVLINLSLFFIYKNILNFSIIIIKKY